MGDVIATLQPCCSADPDREKIATPFLWLHEGRRWAVGTDGHCMAALPYGGELRSDGPDAAKVFPDKPPTHKATIAALRDFAGSVVMEGCTKCGGSKTCTCFDCEAEHPCGQCHGKGEVVAMRHGGLLGGILNRDLLVKILATVPPETAEVTITHADAWDPFTFIAADWLGFIMPIRPGTALDEGAPTFKPRAIR